ncbi:MAG: efflux RND transporter periplasmic adaptor subunit [Pseudorhodoplanes sp.]
MMSTCWRLEAVAALTLAASAWAGPAPAQNAAQPAGAIVTVSRASSSCFSSAVRGNGFLMPRAEAFVNLDAEGFRVTEVLAEEGDDVGSGQALVKLLRQAGPQGPEVAATLKAPSSGVVIKSTARVGAVANPQAGPLFRIAINRDIEVEVEIPSIHMPKLAAGQTARVTIDEGRELNGRVRLISAEIDRTTQLGRARISLERDASLRVGKFATVAIDASRSCGVGIPRAAILYRTDGTSLQVVRNRTVETRKVKVGILSEDRAEIVDGLSDGELVVAHAGTSLRDGDKVTPMFADGTVAAGAR